jgi:acetyl-CoA C-acetyltransferase
MSGALASFSAADLGGFAIAAALERAGVAPDEVEHVIMGQVLMAGQGQVPSRQAAVKAGIPMSVPSVNVNKVCLSGLNTIYLANQMIAAGEADIVVAGGMESMTNAPYIAAGARGGFRYGNTELADAIIKDGLFCAFDQVAMGAGTEKHAASIGLDRQPQDEMAAASHERAARAAPLPARFSGGNPQGELPGATGDRLDGWAVSSGRYAGAAVVVQRATDPFPAGAVLVAEATDPSWSPLFMRAGAIVLERGGPLSHAAILARELGVPAVGPVTGCAQRYGCVHPCG